MRKLIFIFSLLAASQLQAQNVGIGTTTPGYRLDVNGRMRIMSGGNINNSAGLWLNNIANNSTPAFIGMRYDSIIGFYGNIGGWRFLMNTNTGNIALGDFNPSRPLSFPATLEKKISLYPGTTGDAGFGVFGNELRLNSDNANADITLGFDDYQNGFTERMRIKGNGSVAIGTATPASSAILEINSNNKGFLPPRMTASQRDAIISPARGLVIYCTDCGGGELIVYNIFGWTNMMGNVPAGPLSIGQNYGGGIIAYILQPGDPGYITGQTHGLIAATSDASTSAWGCSGTAIPGADGTALGTGNQNTIDIISGCAETDIAAKVCGNLILNGYSDWYLPSKDELNILFINRIAIGNFSNTNFYLSSSEFDNFLAWDQSFSSGAQNTSSKSNLRRVRPIRSF